MLGCPETMKVRDLQGSLSWEKFFICVFEFIGQFFFQNDVFKLQEVISELEIRVFLENGAGRFQAFLILQISDKQSKKIPKIVLKTRQKTVWSHSEATQ
jgi:hypothetical protein